MSIRTSTITYDNIEYTGPQDDWLFCEYYRDEQGNHCTAYHPDAWLYTPETVVDNSPHYSITSFDETFNIDYIEELETQVIYDYSEAGQLTELIITQEPALIDF